MRFLNDGSNRPPRLRRDISWLNLTDLPGWSTGPKGTDEERLAAIASAGYEGVQGADPALARAAGLIPTAMANVQKPGQMEPVLKQAAADGVECVTLHAGSGLEDDAAALRLFEDILAASERTGVPVFIETHRATLTQDIWRAVRFVREFPGMRLNADYSHWYSGLEMPNGDWAGKMEFLRPVFERSCFMHGRIGNSSHIQINIGDGTGLPCVEHFRDLWTRTFAAFLRQAGPGDVLPFAPELLWPGICYAREFPGPDGTLREESDRWEQAAVLTRIAEECFAEAQKQTETTPA